MRLIEWLLLIALSVLWGGTYFFSVIAVTALPPLTLVLLRVSLAAAILVPLTLMLGYRLPRGLSAWGAFVILALLNNLVPFSLMFYGQPRVTGGLASVINATTPLFTVLIARLSGQEPLTGAKLAGILLGLAGVAVLMGPAAVNLQASSLIGMACFLGAAMSYGLSAIWLRRFRDTPPLVSAGAQLLCSSVLMLPLAGYFEQPWLLPAPGWPVAGAVLGLAVLSTALAYVLFFRIIATAGATNVMLVTLLVPVTATALGVLVLGEALAANQVAGGLIIASGLVIIDGRVLRWVKRAG